MNESIKNTEPLISIIIPVFRVEKYLNQCIQSVCGQTYANLEIILIDDGSPDKCPEICEQWGAKDRRIKVVHKLNGGLSDARNAGMKIATGVYVGFIDSDDWISSEMYERLLSAMESNHCDIACCGVEKFWDDSAQREYLSMPVNALLDREEAQIALFRESVLKHPVWYKLYKHELIKDIPFEVGKQHEDVFWSYQAIGRASKVCVIDYVGYHYRQRQDSIMGKRFSLKNLDAIEAYCKRYRYYKKEFPSLEKEGITSIWEACIYYGQMSLLYLEGAEQEAAWSTIRDVIEQYPITVADYCNVSFTHKCWIHLARVSLPMVCRIKNKIGIGL